MEKKPKKGEDPAGPDEREVRIYSLATTANECIVFLEELEGDRLLPIWIGLAEGQAIAIRFSGIVLPRPLTHDLLLSSVKALGWDLDRVTVTDLKENTFYAQMRLTRDAEEKLVDSRPSDAIAVAVRAGCRMFVKEKVFQRCQVLSKPISEDEVKKFKDELKSIRPEDIFKDLKKGAKEKPPPGKKDKGPAEEGKGEPDE
ncbi:MAG: bifunctional nuclease family protein [Elusimicrobia bacterium]|nr:bifunctional nuclease family protein [Elusimicrobiota bacterium]